MPKAKEEEEDEEEDATAVVTQFSGYSWLQIYQAHDSFGTRRKKTEEMANETNFIAVRLLSLAACALIAAIVPVNASADSTKTVDLDIRPGGVVETFTQKIVS